MGIYLGAVYYGQYSTQGLDSSIFGRMLKLYTEVTGFLKLHTTTGA